MRQLFLQLTVIILLASNILNAQSGKLGRMENEVKSSKSKKSSSSSSSYSESSGGNSGGDIIDFFNVVGFALRVSFHLAFAFPGEEDPFLNPEDSYSGLATYPYFDDYSGHFYDDTVLSRISRVEIFGHYHNSKDDISGSYLHFKYSPIKTISLEFNHIYLHEKTTPFEDDNMKIHSAYLNFNRLRFPEFNLWWGVGVLGMKREDSYSGFAFNLGAELYPFKPFSIHGSWQTSSLNETPVNIHKLQGRFHFEKYTPFAGFQSIKIGSEQIKSFSVGVGVYL